MSKHTPGPWVVDKAPSTLGGNGFTVRAGGAIICTAFPGASTDRIEPVAELNARLIAAAPDLLEALRPLTEGVYWITDAQVKAARAAIAKAEGK
jgi:hypothetical protein